MVSASLKLVQILGTARASTALGCVVRLGRKPTTTREADFATRDSRESFNSTSLGRVEPSVDGLYYLERCSRSPRHVNLLTMEPAAS